MEHFEATEASPITQLIKRQSCGWIQWKGTDVCIDIHCGVCGEHTHFDGDFMYQIRCPHCKTVYHANPNIELIEINQTEDINENCCESEE